MRKRGLSRLDGPHYSHIKMFLYYINFIHSVNFKRIFIYYKGIMNLEMQIHMCVSMIQIHKNNFMGGGYIVSKSPEVKNDGR